MKNVISFIAEAIGLLGVAFVVGLIILTHIDIEFPEFEYWRERKMRSIKRIFKK